MAGNIFCFGDHCVSKVFQQVQMVFVQEIRQLVFSCLLLERTFLLAPATYILYQCVLQLFKNNSVSLM